MKSSEILISEYSVPLNKSKKQYSEIQTMLTLMLQELKMIYSNKSSDEYKHAGDISKSVEYKRIEDRISDLYTLKGFNKSNINEIKTLFTTLHRNIFKQMVIEYLKEPNDQNIFYTALYTVGYRVLVGELARIFASTIIVNKNIVYKPDKISREESMDKFIKIFNIELDKAINEFVKIRKASEIKQESVMGDTATLMWKDIKQLAKGSGKILIQLFTGLVTGKFNPLSFIGTALSAGFTHKVKKFDEVCSHYEEAKKALEEYKKLPTHKQDEKIINKYNKLIDKYNIKMQNLKASIEHYDQRAISEAEDKFATKKDTIDKADSSKKKKDNSNTDNDMDF